MGHRWAAGKLFFSSLMEGEGEPMLAMLVSHERAQLPLPAVGVLGAA